MQQLVFTHYSSLSAHERLSVEKEFSQLRTAICIATSTLELGIDIGDIDIVFLWDMPSGVDSFLQRIGRSNRRSNKTNVICLIPDLRKGHLNPSHKREEAGISLPATCQPDVLLDALHFAYYVISARKGDLVVRAPFELYGAFAQQFIVHALSQEEGTWISASSFCDLVAAKEYVSPAIVQSILMRLVDGDFIRKHLNKNKFCASEEAHRLKDMKLIYGNFPLSAQEIKVFHGTKHIGDVPIKNLFSIKQGDAVRFSGKFWQVRRVARDGFHLEPTGKHKDTKDFQYGGQGDHPGPEVMNGIWNLLYSSNFPFELFTKELSQQIAEMLENVRAFSTCDTIPFVKLADGYLYCTFAGTLVNKAISVFVNPLKHEISDIGLFSSSEINWEKIPTDTADYSRFASELFEPGQTQTIYQQRLPLELQKQEFFQAWLKNQAISQILNRLHNSKAVEVKFEDVNLLSINRIENGKTLVEKIRKPT